MATEMSPRISRCLIRREPALVDRWLRTIPGSSQEARLFRGAEARFSPCFGLPFMGNGEIWLPRYDRAGMRAALVRARLQARRDALPAAPPPASAMAYEPSASPPSAADQAALSTAEIGACLAAKHWEEVLTIVRAVDPEAENSFAWGHPQTRAAREREAATVDRALSRTIAALPGCIPSGARARLNRLALRRLLEESALQMTRPDPASPRPAAH